MHAIGSAVYFALGLAHVLILFASLAALALFVFKRLVVAVVLFFAKPEPRKPAVPRQKIYTGALTGPATVRLPHGFGR